MIQLRSNVDALVKAVDTPDRVAVEFIAEGAVSGEGRRGVRLKSSDGGEV